MNCSVFKGLGGKIKKKGKRGHEKGGKERKKEKRRKTGNKFFIH